MATVNFRLRSSANKNVSIYLYLSLGRGQMYQSKTGFSIHPKDWSIKTKKPKQNSAENKKVFSNLNKLEVYIYDQVNVSLANGEIIDKLWLDAKINDCFSRVKKTDRSVVANHVQYIIDNANTRKIKGSNKIGLSNKRIAGYKTFKTIIQDYQTTIKSQIHFMDINKVFVEGFTNWLINDRKYSINHAGKQIDNLKTVCRDAESMDIKTHSYSGRIESFRERNEDRHIITLSFQEIKQIKDAEIKSEALKNVRKWLVVGCAIGQRASDLLRLTEEDVRFEKGNYYIDIIQQKTKRFVTIGVLDPDVIDIIEAGNFPYPISLQKLNKYLKKLCAEAKIDEVVQGKKMDKKTMRKKLDFYPKNELISSHSFRRSFATNYYKKIPTPILINITGHSKESMFLEYINRKEDKDENANLFMKFYQDLNKEKDSELRVIRSSSSA
ncbi:tyrosine-type recombinase/integrase [Salegentibacter holothuriorum]|nr:tyrosine-type recombinase/integrase [Salegentibacter holothuriorum]